MLPGSQYFIPCRIKIGTYSSQSRHFYCTSVNSLYVSNALVHSYMPTKFILALVQRNHDNVIPKLSDIGELRKIHGPRKDERLLNGRNY